MKYTNISLPEMEGFLQTSKGWKKNDRQHKEIIWDYNLKSHPFILIRVYSGILAQTGQSRGLGNDALRVVAVNLKTNKGFIKTSRCYRVEGWKNNLQNRVLQVIAAAKERLKQPTVFAQNNHFRDEAEINKIESGQI